MARKPRSVREGEPHFILQQTRTGAPAFLDDDDRRLYLGALLESSRSSKVAVHAYALADARVEILATPATAAALGQFMQRLGRRYVAGFNHRHARTGPLWAGRFGACALDAERHLLVGMLLVEQMPVRDGCVAEARDWPWSSAAHHVGRRRDPLIVDHAVYWQLGNTPFEREARHARLLLAEVAAAEVIALERATRSGHVVAPEAGDEATSTARHT